MKKIVVLFIVGTLLSFMGCDGNVKDTELLEQIENLWVMSDSSLMEAVMRSAQLKDDVKQASEMVNMKYDLLNIRLRDKQYMIPTSDDSIKKVAAYFEKHGTVQDRIRSYHYLSSVYRDLHDSPRAITNDLKALELIKSTDEKDSLILMHIYSNLSFLYRCQLNMDESICMALEYLNLFPNDPWALMDVACGYQNKKDSVNAMIYYDKAYDIMMADSLFISHPSNYLELLGIYARYGEKEKADVLFKRLYEMKAAPLPSNYDIAFGLYHKTHNNLDSALIYFEHRYENADNLDGRCDAAEQIMECYYKKGDNAKAADWAMKFRDANDSVIAERQFDLTRNALAEYHYQKDVEEETRIKLRALNMQRWLLVVLLLSLLAGVAAYAYYVRKRRRLESQINEGRRSISRLRREMEEKNDSMMQIREQLAEVNSSLDEKRIELTSVIQSMVEKQRELIGMKETLGKRELEMIDLKTRLVETDNQISKLQYELAGKSMTNKDLIKELVSKELTEMNTDILELFDKSLTHKVRLTETQWRGFFANMDAKHPDFKEQINERVPRLNVALLRTAYLMLAGLSNQQIEAIMGVSRQTQWERAKKLETYVGDLLPFRK